MSLVHQKMYQTSNFKEINLDEYIREILENISEIYNDDNYNAVIEIPENKKLNIDSAVPTGLIVNEIISNFFKHVKVSEKDKKSFRISLIQDSEGTQTLEYEDNGNGFPVNFKLDESSSLGMLLITTLAEQLDGNLEYYNNDGAVYKVSIPDFS